MTGIWGWNFLGLVPDAASWCHRPCSGPSPLITSGTWITWECSRAVVQLALKGSVIHLHFPRHHCDPHCGGLWASVLKKGKWQRGKQCVIFSQMNVFGLVQHWPINSVPSLIISCSFPKLYGSCPAEYFRRCLAISLWLFYCPSFFIFYFFLYCIWNLQ